MYFCFVAKREAKRPILAVAVGAIENEHPCLSPGTAVYVFERDCLVGGKNGCGSSRQVAKRESEPNF